MKILSIGPYVPYASITHAGGTFLHHYLSTLVARGDAVALVAPDTPSNRAALASSPPAGVDIHLVSRPLTASRHWVRAPFYPYEVLTAPSPGLGMTRSFARDLHVAELLEA